MAETSSAEEPPARQTNKSASAFRTISEVAAELSLPQHVLRFWEGKFSQIRPMKRGGGRRYYRPEDIELLRRIRSLLYDDGYTIKGVQKLLKQESGRGGQGGDGSSRPATNDGLSDDAKAELRQVLAELDDIKKLI